MQQSDASDALFAPVPLLPAAQVSDGTLGQNVRVWPLELGTELPVRKDRDGNLLPTAPRAELGFAAGAYLPPEGELVDPRLLARLAQPFDDGRASAQTYAFALLARRLTQADVDAWSAAGVRVLGTHPHNALKLALPAEALGALGASSAVRWIGFAQPWQKLQPQLLQRASQALPGEKIPAYVSVFESDECAASTREPMVARFEADPGHAPVALGLDGEAGVRMLSHGWQHKRLEALGLEVVEYLPRLATFSVRLRAEQLPALIEQDFVQFAEVRLDKQPTHDESTPLILSDYVRKTYDGANSGQAMGGVIDSGMDIDHDALQHAYSAGWDYSSSSVWIDICEHGTHVIGTVLADPPAPNQELRGNAPGLGFAANRRFRTVKIFEHSSCDWTGAALPTLFSHMRNSYTDGSGNTSPKPHFVSNSWGSGFTAGGWYGTETDPRAIDDEVYDQGQSYLYANGNDGPGASTVAEEACSKNAISVGNVLPYPAVGTISSGSSRGPTADGRWKPSVCAPGTSIQSCDAGTANGFSSKSGTSMATPHVAGVVAQLVDHYAFLRYQAASVTSLLMATATPKANQTLNPFTTTHFNTYGAGRVDAYRANFVDGQHAWSSWPYTMVGGGNGLTGDFTVGAGATRLVAVLHWIEPPASAGASKAVNADWDFYLDAAPFSAGTNTGEYGSALPNDNTEILSFDNPTAGDWRWKAHPDSVGLFDLAKLAVTVHVIYGDTTPNLSLSLSSADRYLQPGDTGSLRADVFNPNHIAAGVYISESSSGALLSSTTTLEDGYAADHMDNTQGGQGVCLGDIRFGDTRSIDWGLRWNSEGVKTVSVTSDGDNTSSDTSTYDFYVDGTAPALPGNLHSSTHQENVWSNDPDITYAWTASTDGVSGLDGYGISLAGAAGLPGTIKDIEGVTSYSETLTNSSSSRYFNIRPVDNCGNWNGSYAATGPYKIDLTDPGVVTNLQSNGHPTIFWNNDPTFSVTWTAAPDTFSGVDGYGLSITGGQSIPAASKDIEALSSTTVTLPSSTFGYYVNIRAVDNAGNWSPNYASIGPYLTDTGVPTGVSVNAPATGTTTTLDLTIAATDAISGVDEMRFKNEGGFFSPWEPFATTKAFNLLSFGGSGATGTHTITLEVRDKAGNVSSDTDTVVYYHPVAYFGSECSGSLGLPKNSVANPVQIGKSASFQVTSTAAPLKQLYLGLSKATWNGIPLPLDLGLIGSPGCDLNISPDFLMSSGPAASFAFTVPNDQVIVGLHVYSQWMLFSDPSGKLVVATRGADVEVNGS